MIPPVYTKRIIDLNQTFNVVNCSVLNIPLTKF